MHIHYISIMKRIYNYSENFFEKLVSIATTLLGNSITFILAFFMVISWWAKTLLSDWDFHLIVGDMIFGITFLSLFIIQKSFNRFSASLHLKVNELVSSHETANNAVINAEIKTEKEIIELSKEYADLIEEIKEEMEESEEKPED